MNDIAILLVERSAEERTLIQEYLSVPSAYNVTLSEAESLTAALSLLDHQEFDVILLDLQLPDSSGLDTARRIITELQETAVIVLASPEDVELGRQAVYYGTEDYLEKKFLSSAMLVKAIHYAMERKKIIQEKFDVLSDLVLALEKIDHLESLLPICIGCKKIYQDDNQWLELEEYTQSAPQPNAGRLICPDCQKDLDKN